MTGRAIVISLTFVSLVAGCDGSSGSAPKRFKFRTFNVSPCEEFSAVIDLEKAGAVLARLADNAPDCALASVLEDCDVLFEELSGGNKLHVAIANCDIPLNTALFDCGFTQAEVKTLEAAIDSNCACSEEPNCYLNSICHPSPPVCVNEENGVVGCEACNNGIDDNGDGDVDCNDEDCKRTEVCGWGWTTVTCPPTTYDSTTLPPTTTPTTDTTLPVEGCEVVFRTSDAVTFGALEWLTTYNGGSFVGTGGNVECASLVAGALAAFSDDDAAKELDSGLISLDGFTGPMDLASCTFEAALTPLPSDFSIVVLDATGTDLNPIEPAPEITIVSIDCGASPARPAPALQAAPSAD